MAGFYCTCSSRDFPSASSEDVDEVVDFSFSCFMTPPTTVSVGPPTKLIFGAAFAAVAVAAGTPFDVVSGLVAVAAAAAAAAAFFAAFCSAATKTGSEFKE